MHLTQLARVLLILVTLSTVSCASYFKRKECEKTNWFEYGQSVAMQGRRISGDNFVNDCRQVEAEINEAQLDSGFKKGMADYCKPETAYATGRKGDFFSPDMCVGEGLKLLQKKHADGVRAYCAPSNGINAGSSGRKYNNVCPSEMEAAFLPEFNKGRKRYLLTVIHQKEQQIDDLDRDIDQLQNRRSDLSRQLSGVGQGIVRTRQRTFDAATNTWRESEVVTEDEATKRRREDLERDIRLADSEMSQKREEQRKARAEIREMQTESAGLD